VFVSDQKKVEIFPLKIRLLAVAAGCVNGLALSLLSPLFFLLHFPLILGATLQPYSPRVGKWVMSAGVLITTLYSSQFAVLAAISIGRLRLHHAFEDLAFLSLFLTSIILVVWCDAALVADARRLRRADRRAR
jgi:hypothetical protein